MAEVKKDTTKKTVPKVARKTKTADATKTQHIGLVKNDSWLEPFEDAIRGRTDSQVLRLDCFMRKVMKTRYDNAG